MRQEPHQVERKYTNCPKASTIGDWAKERPYKGVQSIVASEFHLSCGGFAVSITYCCGSKE